MSSDINKLEFTVKSANLATNLFKVAELMLKIFLLLLLFFNGQFIVAIGFVTNAL